MTRDQSSSLLASLPILSWTFDYASTFSYLRASHWLPFQSFIVIFFYSIEEREVGVGRYVTYGFLSGKKSHVYVGMTCAPSALHALADGQPDFFFSSFFFSFSLIFTPKKHKHTKLQPMVLLLSLSHLSQRFITSFLLLRTSANQQRLATRVAKYNHKTSCPLPSILLSQFQEFHTLESCPSLTFKIYYTLWNNGYQIFLSIVNTTAIILLSQLIG